MEETKQKEITKNVLGLIEKSIEGSDLEDENVEFKRKWYDLKCEKEINEFLKDTTAIVNRVGLTGYLIIGFDDREKKLYEAKFSDCNLKDKNELFGLINKRVDRVFDFDVHEITIENRIISVIELPPSIDKPHVIRCYKTFDKKGNVLEYPNRIFVRKGTTNRVASKYDLELIYAYRDKIRPEYKLMAYYRTDNMKFSVYRETIICLDIQILIENLGIRTAAISDFIFEIPVDNTSNNYIQFHQASTEYIPIVKSNEILSIKINLISNLPDKYHMWVQEIIRFLWQEKNNLPLNEITLKLSNGKRIVSELKKIGEQ